MHLLETPSHLKDYLQKLLERHPFAIIFDFYGEVIYACFGDKVEFAHLSIVSITVVARWGVWSYLPTWLGFVYDSCNFDMIVRHGNY